VLVEDFSSSSADADVPIVKVPKTAEARHMITEALLSNYLFAKLHTSAVDMAVDAMKPSKVAASSFIIRQGDVGDEFFVLQSGTVEFIVKGNVVGSTSALATFGELALIYNTPRTASVRAKTECELWVINRPAFRKALSCASTATHLRHMKLLSKVPSFKDLSPNQITVLVGALEEKSYADQDPIITQGDVGETFYIIESGFVDIDVSGNIVAQLKAGMFFGERALITAEKRNATCLANGPVSCLTLEKRHFNVLLGDLKELLAVSEARAAETAEAVSSKTPQQTRRKSVAERAAAPAKDPVRRTSWAGDISEFDVVRTIGKGTFGVVKLATHGPTRRTVAIKCMSKAQIVSQRQTMSVMNECRSLQRMNHPFVLSLLGTLQDSDRLYLILNVVQGGELWSLLYQSRALPRTEIGGFHERDARMYAAQVIAGIGHIHARGFMYRDLKPENLMIDRRGYLKIVDFGFCKRIPPTGTKSNTLCGTPEYLAPELVLQKGHTQSVDFWAFGCLIFEMLTNDTPFADGQQARVFKKIVNCEKLLPYLFARRFPRTAKNLIELLLVPNASLRLGMQRGGVAGVKGHRWFAGMDFEKLEGKRYRSPFRPRIRGELDTSHFEKYEEEEEEGAMGTVKPYTGDDAVFRDFAVVVTTDMEEEEEKKSGDGEEKGGG